MRTPKSLPKKMVAVLERLSEAVLPLEDWVAKNPYTSPQSDTLPWHTTAKPLTTHKLEALRFVQQNLAQTEDEEQRLAKRFRAVAKDPLKHFRTWKAAAARWRSDRGLEHKAKFGAADSTNVPLAEPDYESASKVPVPRIEFYLDCWPRLRAAVASFCPLSAEATPQEAASLRQSWSTFAGLLLKGEFGSQLAEFVKVFAMDVLDGLMNQHHPVRAGEWKSAVLIELGEHRRPGNKRTVEEVEQAVSELRQELEKNSPPIV